MRGSLYTDRMETQGSICSSYRMRCLSIATTLVLLTGCATPQRVAWPAGSEHFKVDAVHSSIGFRIEHLNVAFFYGRFNDVSGTFAFDEADPANTVLDIHIRAASIDTHNALRDRHLKSADFFNIGKFKEITFRSTGANRLDEHRFNIAGNLTLLGVTQPLTVMVTRTGTGPGMHGEQRSGFETSFQIKRSDFGMNAMLDLLGNDVTLTVSIEGVKE
jgi:polyisoprenoid-binding protein YceI